MMKGLFPFKINRLQVNESEIHFENEYSNAAGGHLSAPTGGTVTNLTNVGNTKSELPAGVVAHGEALGGGDLQLNIQLNPLVHLPTYQLDCQLTNVNLAALNNFFEAYGNFDVDRGHFALFASVASKGGNYDGYLKVFFEHLHVFEWKKEKKEDALQVFWDAIVGTVTTALKNQSKDQLATRIPFSGSYDSGNVDILSAVGSLLRNAFIRALVPRLGEKITIHKVDQDRKKKEALPPPRIRKGATQLLKP